MSRMEANLNARIENLRETIPNVGDILWVSGLTSKQKSSLLRHHGPTLSDVEQRLGVNVHYERYTPEIHDTQQLLDNAMSKLEDLKEVLETSRRGTNLRYFRIYNTLFGLKRVTFAQLTEVIAAVREQGVMIPTKMALYFKFAGYTQFMARYLDWLRAENAVVPEGVDPETGEITEPSTSVQEPEVVY